MAEKCDRRQLLRVLGTGLVAVGMPSAAIGQTLTEEQARQMAQAITQSPQGTIAECASVNCPQGYCSSHCPQNFCPSGYCESFCPSGYSC